MTQNEKRNSTARGPARESREDCVRVRVVRPDSPEAGYEYLGSNPAIGAVVLQIQRKLHVEVACVF